MDNLVVQFLIEYWPVIIATVITLCLVYQYLRPKLTAEDLQKGAIQRNVLSILQDESPPLEQEGKDDEWLASLQRVQQLLPSQKPARAAERMKPKQYITVSFIWVLFWIGASIFLTIRILFNPYYYGGEAAFLGYFVYYIVIGLISYFRR